MNKNVDKLLEDRKKKAEYIKSYRARKKKAIASKNSEGYQVGFNDKIHCSPKGSITINDVDANLAEKRKRRTEYMRKYRKKKRKPNETSNNTIETSTQRGIIEQQNCPQVEYHPYFSFHFSFLKLLIRHNISIHSLSLCSFYRQLNENQLTKKKNKNKNKRKQSNKLESIINNNKKKILLAFEQCSLRLFSTCGASSAQELSS